MYCHFTRQKLESRDSTTRFVNSNEQLLDIFTKSLRGQMINYTTHMFHKSLWITDHFAGAIIEKINSNGGPNLFEEVKSHTQ